MLENPEKSWSQFMIMKINNSNAESNKFCNIIILI